MSNILPATGILLYFIGITSTARLCESLKYSHTQAFLIGAAFGGLFCGLVMGIGYFMNGEVMLINGSVLYSSLAVVAIVSLGGVRCFDANKKHRVENA